MLKDVTVVIPFYNGNKFLNETLLSIVKNDRIHSVIICVDRGSCRPLYDSLSVPIVVLDNVSGSKGAGVARALGFKAATTRFVAFVDCDDVWSSDKIGEQARLMGVAGYAFSFHGYWNFNVNGVVSNINVSGPYTLERFLKKQFTIGCLTVMVDKTLCSKLEGNSLRKRNDYFMWFQLIKKLEAEGLRWGGFDLVAAGHRLHPDSLTHSRVNAAFHHFLFLKRCGIPLPKRLYYFFYYIVNTLGRR